MKKFYNNLKESANYNVLILAVLVALVIKSIHYIYLTVVNIYQIVAWDMLEVYGIATVGSTALAILFIVLAISFIVQACKRDPKFMIGAITSLAVVAAAGVSFCAVQCIIACGYWFWMVTKAFDRPVMKHVKKITIILFCVSFAVFLIWELSVWIPEGFGNLYEEAWFAMAHLLRNIFNPEVFLLIYIYRNIESKQFRIILKVVAVVIVAAIVIHFVVGLASLGSLGRWSEWGPGDGAGSYNSIEEGDWSEWETLDENGSVVYYDEEGNSSTMQSFEFD